VRGTKITLCVETEVEKYRARTYETKEPETLSWIETFFNEGDVFFDIGACIGVYSLFAAKILHRNVVVHAFEPAYHNFFKLCSNIIQNDLIGTIIPHCIGLSNRTSIDVLNMVSTEIGSSGHNVGQPIDYLGKTFEPVFVQGLFCTAVDELIDPFDFPIPNHIKIDVDGLEPGIIQGMTKTVSNESVRSILVEVNNKTNERKIIENILFNAGFSLDHPINLQENHSRHRRKGTPVEMAENLIFSR